MDSTTTTTTTTLTDIQNLEHFLLGGHWMEQPADVWDCSSLEDSLWGHPEHEGEEDDAFLECTTIKRTSMIQQQRAQQTAAVIELWHRWSSTEEDFQQQQQQQQQVEQQQPTEEEEMAQG
jgi:hypothetical protein